MILLCLLLVILGIRKCEKAEQTEPVPVVPVADSLFVVADTVSSTHIPDTYIITDSVAIAPVEETAVVVEPVAAEPVDVETEPAPEPKVKPEAVAEPEPEAEPVAEPAPVVEPEAVAEPVEPVAVVTEEPQKKSKKQSVRPEIFAGVKTNVLSDAVGIPSLGLEYFLGPHISVSLDGWYAPFNMFYPDYANNFYGFSPEVRFWLSNKSVLNGHFFGMHANFAWFETMWPDKEGNMILYQNTGEGNYNNPGNAFNSPNWSFGFTYGYYLRLGRKQNWGLEFYAGAGYIKSVQNIGKQMPSGAWYLSETESRSYLGLTKVGISLTYRFFHGKKK